MLDEPYRWVEAIRNRREYTEDQLAGASPVVALAYDDGLLLLTSTPGPRKLFEVYNQVAFAGIGHPADIEKLRKAVIDIAHVEVFNLSASDVSLQRLVNLGVGPLMKSAFDEIFRSPYIARVLVAELDPPNPAERFYTIDPDGTFNSAAAAAAIAGSSEAAEAILARLRGGEGGEPLDAALDRALRAWGAGRSLAGREPDETGKPGEGEVDDEEVREAVRAALDGGRFEAAVLERSRPTKTKFRLLGPGELAPSLAAFE